MRDLRFLLLLMFVPLFASGQKTEAELQDRLIGKPLYLRGFYGDDKLKFDADGRLKGGSKTVSFTLSGVEVTRVQMDRKSLLIWGRRVAVRFEHDQPQRIPMTVGKPFGHKDEAMQVEIAAPGGGDYGVALDTVFADGLVALAPSLPEYWQPWAKRVLLAEPGAKGGHRRSNSKVGGGVTAPRVKFAPEPEFSETARRMKVAGNVLVYLVVGTDGLPTEVSIIRPLGFGLDEKALQAVRGYRFTPAMENGEPVPVEMNVEVNFQIF